MSFNNKTACELKAFHLFLSLFEMIIKFFSCLLSLKITINFNSYGNFKNRLNPIYTKLIRYLE